MDRVEAGFYDNEEEFVKDVRKIFNNWWALFRARSGRIDKLIHLALSRFYNDPSTNYVKNANKLEQYFNERLKLKKAELGLP